ncbi:class I SAM-dependent methyltransferase [Namhaeicola litoreus]|uniref:Class I SAM-dependent methyltransferase n=1 Tax=Namhaeicola litoreus TaxID=1052145 RepID=A0ABW3Y4K5_9FLAO
MTKKNSPDIMGSAMLDFYRGRHKEDIITYSSISGEDVLPLAHLFRSFDQMPLLEQTALSFAKGKILDIGCGAGIHSLYLQQKGFDVHAIDTSKGAIEVCKLRGIKKADQCDIYSLKKVKYDTIYALMNGIGICGKISKLTNFLIHLKSLLKENGQIITDSSDLKYMVENENYFLEKSNHYYGEVEFEMFYKLEQGRPFDWLYVDFDTLQEHARKAGLSCTMLKKGKHYDYLAKLTAKK